MKPNQITRRQFIIKSAGTLPVAATPIALPGFVHAQSGASAKKLRIGIVGGRFGLGFQFHEHPECIVEAVSDLRSERLELLQKTYRCTKAYGSLEELVKDPKVEAVFLATPMPDHVRHVLLCLAAGKHVLCAVPAAMTLEECQQLIDAVKKTGLTYMMAETAYWMQHIISARKFYQEGAFGNLFYTESAYHHSGLEVLYFENGKRTWRYGMAPMLYPTHNTVELVSITGERLTEVTCLGWGDDSPILKDNSYKNPFWTETGLFKTNHGHAMRIFIGWRGLGAFPPAIYFGDKMTFYSNSHFIRSKEGTEKDSGGFPIAIHVTEPYEKVQWWKTDMLPEALRHDSGHEGSHCFITHEFVDSVLKQRKPLVDIHEAVAYTAPGIVAHQSALKGGELMKIPQFG